MRRAYRGIPILPVIALGLLLVAPNAMADPVLPWCPDQGPDDEGFYSCPCPACMAPCIFQAEPQGECKGPDGSIADRSFTCCCCGGSAGYSFRYFSPELTLRSVGDDSLLTWTDVPGAAAFDLVSGDLASLRRSRGDFGQATKLCLDDDNPATSFLVDATPAPGQCIWFLVRGEEAGSYDAPSGSQMTSRDPAIAASGNDCS